MVLVSKRGRGFNGCRDTYRGGSWDVDAVPCNLSRAHKNGSNVDWYLDTCSMLPWPCRGGAVIVVRWGVDPAGRFGYMDATAVLIGAECIPGGSFLGGRDGGDVDGLLGSRH